jgi:hypothetical protein
MTLFKRQTLLVLINVLWPALIAPPLYSEATHLNSLRYSPDVTVLLGDTTVGREEVAEDNLSGLVVLVNIGAGAFSPGTNVDAYHLLPNGNQLLSFDITITLPGQSGPITAGPADVVLFDGSFYSLVFDGAANGIPPGVNVHDVTVFRGNLVLSFDVTVKLSEQLTATPTDLVLFDGTSFSPFFDGTAAGLPPGMDLGGVHLLPNGHLLLAFDISGTIAGVIFDNNDVLDYYPPTSQAAVVYDGVMQHAGWAPAQIDALSASPAATTPCDVNGDGKIDVNDINDIFAARGMLATGSDDPRDPDGDGVITVNDARVCVLRCTNSLCAP